METKKRMSKEQKREQAIIDLINQMFLIAGHGVTYDDIKDRKDNWFTQWTITVEQYENWKKFGENYLHKNLKLNKKSAEKEMSWIGLMWGLKFSDFTGTLCD